MIRLLILLIPLVLWSDIDAQIEAIQKAPIQERYKLMNAFKNKIIKMREEERLQALKKLQKKTKTKIPTLRQKQKIEEFQIEEHHDIQHDEVDNEEDESHEKEEENE